MGYNIGGTEVTRIQFELSNALLKAKRAAANGGVDPVSGFSFEEILDWVDYVDAGGPHTFEDEQAIAAARRRLQAMIPSA